MRNKPNGKYFIGFKNIAWLIKELIKLYSAGEESYFSKKRLESGIAFIIMQWGMIAYFIHKYTLMDMYDLIMWAGVEGVICGYTINAIQKEKVGNKEVKTTEENPPAL